MTIPRRQHLHMRGAARCPLENIEGAKALLAQAGYGPENPLKIDFYTAEYIPGATALAQVFKEQAAQAGIEVNLSHWTC